VLDGQLVHTVLLTCDHSPLYHNGMIGSVVSWIFWICEQICHSGRVAGGRLVKLLGRASRQPGCRTARDCGCGRRRSGLLRLVEDVVVVDPRRVADLDALSMTRSKVGAAVVDAPFSSLTTTAPGRMAGGES